MSTNNIKFREMQKDLISGNEEKILAALQNTRENGNPALLPDIISLLFEEPHGSVKCAAINVLNDLKNKDSIPYLIEFLKSHRGRIGYKYLVSACWQNGLDFSDDLDLFVDIALEDDFETALEAFTVIEEHLPNIDKKEVKNLAIKVSLAPDITDDVKKRLIKELGIVIAENLPA